MKNKLLKKVITVVILFVYCIYIFEGFTEAVNITNNYTNEQLAIREIADAYYRKGINSQYCSFRKSFVDSPEEATSQHTIYSVCSDYIFSTYYQAFGIKLPFITNGLIAYAQKFYDSNNIVTNDVIEYWQVDEDGGGNKIYKDNKGNVKDIDLSTAKGRQKYAIKLLQEYNLEVGDIISYFPDGSEGNTIGHTMIVYDIIYDENGNPVDALIRESTSNYEKKTTKITKGLSYSELLNENNNIYEGTFQEKYLNSVYESSSTRKRNSVMYKAKSKSYFAVLRPLLKDENGNYTGKYYYSSYKSNDTAIKYECVGRKLTDYKFQDATKQRMKYSAIDIEKTVNKFNNSVVDLGDVLEYTIKIKNNSDTKYNSFDVVENISDYVEIIDNGNGTIKDNTLNWNIKNLNANKSIEIKYKVKIKYSYSALGKEIISTGTVAGIQSSTVRNTISSNLSDSEKTKISNKLKNELISKKYSGYKLIENIYNEEFGTNFSLENFDISDLIKTRTGTQYYSESSSNKPTISLNKENDFAKMILSNYFGALNTTSSGRIQLKYWENSKATLEGRSERADTIYKDNLQTGDILIYKNVQESNDQVSYKTENGTYYLIYISEENKIMLNNEEISGFIGINENGKINNVSTKFEDLRTLLGKDYYVILRPSLELDMLPMKAKIKYSSTEKTKQDVVVTITSNEEMLGIDGWDLSNDRKTLTKVYTKNKTEDVTIYDLAGNSIIKTIKVENIDKEKPILNINYTTTKPTNQNVTVTITSNEEIQEVDDWSVSNDKKTLTKTYTENKTEKINVIDLAGNSSEIIVEVKNIDKENPIVEVKYSTLELTKDDVYVKIVANESVQEIEGWQIEENRKVLYKTYTKNDEETVKIYDLAGNEIVKTIKIENIDKEKPNYEIQYSTTTKTNENVMVTITVDKEIQKVDGWILSADKKMLTKEYNENTEETIIIKDVVGNIIEAAIKIENIDKVPPTININYSNKDLTNQDVIATITSNEEIKAVEGWVLDDDGKTLTKRYVLNKEENIIIYDLAGNKVEGKITINNIDKEAPILEVIYSKMSAADRGLSVMIKSNEAIKEVDKWNLSTDMKQLTRIYTESANETVVILDLAGNSQTVNISVDLDKKSENVDESKDDTSENNKKDETLSDITFPNAGKKKILLTVGTLLLVCVIMFFWKKYKNTSDF